MGYRMFYREADGSKKAFDREHMLFKLLLGRKIGGYVSFLLWCQSLVPMVI